MRNRLMLAILLPILSCIILAVPAEAENSIVRDSLRNEIRIGWGDQLFEHLIWQSPQYIISNMPESYVEHYNERYRYTQHWFAEYQWRVNKWFGVGAMADISGCLWDEVTRNGTGKEIDRIKNKSFWNLAIMPTFRFTWFNREHISLYSSIGAGIGVNGGTETDYLGRYTLCAVAVDIAPIGITAEWDRWFICGELGGLYSIKGMTSVFMLNSRILSIGAGVRF